MNPVNPNESELIRNFTPNESDQSESIRNFNPNESGQSELIKINSNESGQSEMNQNSFELSIRMNPVTPN